MYCPFIKQDIFLYKLHKRLCSEIKYVQKLNSEYNAGYYDTYYIKGINTRNENISIFLKKDLLVLGIELTYA